MKKESDSAPLRKEDYELLAEFRYTLRKFLRFSEEAATRCDLTPQQYQVLLAIEGFPSRNYVTVGELAERLQIAHHSAVGLADRLEKTGLIARRVDSDDRRKVWLSLTKPGLNVLEKLYRVHRSELRSVGPRLASLLRIAAEKMPGDSDES